MSCTIRERIARIYGDSPISYPITSSCECIKSQSHRRFEAAIGHVLPRVPHKISQIPLRNDHVFPSFVQQKSNHKSTFYRLPNTFSLLIPHHRNNGSLERQRYFARACSWTVSCRYDRYHLGSRAANLGNARCARM
jgi:hypothetical protein